MPRFRFHASCSIFLRNFVFSQVVFMMVVSYSLKEQTIFVMSKRLLINLQSLAFKLFLGSVNLSKKRCNFLVMLLLKTVLNRKILEFQTPSNTSELTQFLGMASFFRKFVDNFSSKAFFIQHAKEKSATVHLDYWMWRIILLH